MAASAAAAAAAGELKEKIEALRDNVHHMHNQFQTAWTNRHFEFDEIKAHQVAPIRNKLQQRLKMTGHTRKVMGVAICPDRDNILVSAAQDGKILVWDPISQPGGQKLGLIDLRSEYVLAVDVAAGGELICSGGMDYSVSVFSREAVVKEQQEGKGSDYSRPIVVMGNSETRTDMHQGFVYSCKFLGSDRTISASQDGSIKICSFAGQKKGFQVETTLLGHNESVLSVAVHPTNKSLFLSSGSDGTARLWDIRDPIPCKQTYLDHESDVNQALFHPNETSFGTASDDGRARLFDIRSWGRLNVYTPQMGASCVTALAFSKSGRMMFLGHDGNELSVCDTITTQVLDPPLRLFGAEHVSSLAMPSSGSYLAAGTYGKPIFCFA